MTQKDRDRLVVLKKAQKKLITQRQAAEELGVTERHVRPKGAEGDSTHRARRFSHESTSPLEWSEPLF